MPGCPPGTGTSDHATTHSSSATLTAATVGLFNLVVWYGRLHFRLLKPAIDQV